MNLKGVFTGVIIGSMGVSTIFASGIVKNIDVSYSIDNVFLQDKKIEFNADNKPFIYNGLTYAPLRTIVEEIGGEIYFTDYDNSVNIYTTDNSKLRQLEKAIENLGVVTPEKAIEVFSMGMKERSGIMQYSVMTDALKKAYSKSLEDNDYIFWVTGV